MQDLKSKCDRESLQYKKEKIFSMKDVRESEAGRYSMDEIFGFCEDYRMFLNSAKTERMCASWAEKYLEDKGFRKYRNEKLVPGDKYYFIYKNKVTVAFTAGETGLENGVNILAAHVDSPRLDLKPHPLYEDSDICFMKTHYYGGIKKYQWASVPLMLTGVVVRRDGSSVNVEIGGEPSDPVLYISDLLIHLAREQMKRSLGEGIKGEELNVISGTVPFKGEDIKDPVKENVLRILNEKYDIDEEDLFTAELTLVPALEARDAGLDRSMIAAYGHDDKVCAYTSLRALTDVSAPLKTSVCVWADKEEIGSMGVTGLQSDILINFLNRLAGIHGVSVYDIIDNSACLSADVDGAYDPIYQDAYDAANSSELGGGIVISKYTGGGGKYDASDASAEFAGKIRKIFNDAGIIWQISDMGKIDQGGGGTVSQFVANRGIDTLDCGVPVISMHAPYELVSKADVYMAYRAYRAFLEDGKNSEDESFEGHFETLLEGERIEAESVQKLLLKVCGILAQKNISVLALMVDNDEFSDAGGYYFSVDESRGEDHLITGTGIYIRGDIGRRDAEKLIEKMKAYYGI